MQCLCKPKSLFQQQKPEIIEKKRTKIFIIVDKEIRC